MATHTHGRSVAVPIAAVATALCLWGLLPSAAQVVSVPAGADLQAAIDRARPGDVLTLAPGATYTGNFTLPARDGTSYITIRTAADARQPRPGQRVLPVHAAALAQLRSSGPAPVLRTAPGAHHWRLQLLEISAQAPSPGDLIALGDGGPDQNSVSRAAHDLIVDRCYVHGDPDRAQKRGIALNSASTSITNSYVADIKAAGQDSQAIAGWNGPGPYTIENTYLEAAGENFLLGGADPAIGGLVPQDVVFRRNHLAKPVAWREQRWTVKNLFELKNARRVLVEGNLMENVWRDGQSGYAILLTPRNQDGGAPWAVVEDVTIRRNLVRHAGGALTITGRDTNHPSGTTRRVRISDNLFADIDGAAWGGPGAFLLVGDAPEEIAVTHNTVLQSGNIITAFGGAKDDPAPIRGLVFADNLLPHNAFGVIGTNLGVGRSTLDAYFPDAVFRGNTIGGGDASRYPAGNLFITREAFDSGFVDRASEDFRLGAASPARRTGSDGRDPGADMAALALAMGRRAR